MTAQQIEPSPPRRPLVSVVIATYNRSNILRLALESLRRSSLGDWEAQVIGDGCTDDTESIVEQMGDDRIHFHNLPQNFGEQSRPNNVGCERARGRYVAFLNHDDLYFPDHLETSVDVIEKTDADLVFSASLRAPPRTPEQLKAGEWRFSFGSCPAGKKYLPYTFVSASRWLMKRELIQAIGPWKPAVSCYGAPSQDFLFRAWKRGKLLSFKPRATVLTMSSSTRVKAYARRESHENEFWWEQMLGDPRFREKALERAGLILAGADARRAALGGKVNWAYRLLYRPVLSAGRSPEMVRHWQRYGWKKRNLINTLRKRRGLEEI